MTRLLGTLLLLAAVPFAPAGNWPQWRGPTGDSVCTEHHVPLHWGEGQNVVWKCPLPDGASTPAIWGDAIFATGEDGDRLLAFRIDAATGKVVWTRQVGTGTPARERVKTKEGSERQHQRFHRLQNLASPSPVTDGAVVVVHYGSGELIALDFAGKELWRHDMQKEYGDYTVWYGHANSPVIAGDLVISVCMQDSLSDVPAASPAPSYLVAHDKVTGKERWRTPRSTGAPAEQGDAYTTPLLATVGGRQQLIVMGGNQIDGYDPVTGKQLWYLPNVVGGRTVTGPTSGGGLVFATQGMSGPLLAVRPGEGKLGENSIVWTQKQGTPDTCCPVVWQGLLYWITDVGIANCVDALTGELKWKERLPGQYKASPVVAEGRVYFLNLAGLCTVVAAGPKFQKLAENTIDDGTIASPAFADGRLYLRGRKALYCIR